MRLFVGDGKESGHVPWNGGTRRRWNDVSRKAEVHNCLVCGHPDRDHHWLRGLHGDQRLCAVFLLVLCPGNPHIGSLCYEPMDGGLAETKLRGDEQILEVSGGRFGDSELQALQQVGGFHVLHVDVRLARNGVLRHIRRLPLLLWPVGGSRLQQRVLQLVYEVRRLQQELEDRLLHVRDHSDHGGLRRPLATLADGPGHRGAVDAVRRCRDGQLGQRSEEQLLRRPPGEEGEDYLWAQIRSQGHVREHEHFRGFAPHEGRVSLLLSDARWSS
mmetsp:Transcript_102503/g.260352  ORF Transcript_102503/g.260352 Transcript_102503/m.260352 type:complete len:272 (+) Transcript_102503:259-1074(+)